MASDKRSEGFLALGGGSPPRSTEQARQAGRSRSTVPFPGVRTFRGLRRAAGALGSATVTSRLMALDRKRIRRPFFCLDVPSTRAEKRNLFFACPGNGVDAAPAATGPRSSPTGLQPAFRRAQRLLVSTRRRLDLRREDMGPAVQRAVALAPVLRFASPSRPRRPPIDSRSSQSAACSFQWRSVIHREYPFSRLTMTHNLRGLYAKVAKYRMWCLRRSIRHKMLSIGYLCM